jgi:serine/threonine-protein kinase RsbW
MRTRVTGAEEPTVDARFCLVFPREAVSVPVVRHVLGDALTKIGVDEDCVADLLLAVTEACTNVLRHSGHARRYEVVAEIRSNRCTLEVVDTGRGFNPAKLAARKGRPRGVYPFRRRRAQWPYPAAHANSPMRARLARVTHRAELRAIRRLPESGRGLAIMRACVDDVTLRSQPGRGTVVALQKRIELRSDAPLSQAGNLQLRDVG